MGKANKASFPMQGEVFKRETTNGYYNPTSVQQALQSSKNKKQVEARVKLAKKTNLNPPQKSTEHQNLFSQQLLKEDIEIVNLELELGGISKKPVIYVLNVDEEKISDVSLISEVEKRFKEKAIAIAAKLEEELTDFSESERREY